MNEWMNEWMNIYIYIYIYVCMYMRYFFPSDLLLCEGIMIYSRWQTVNAKLNNYVVWWGKKPWQTEYTLGIWPWYWACEMKGLLYLMVRPVSFVETLDTIYSVTWHHIWLYQRTHLIVRLMNCLLIVTMIYTILTLILRRSRRERYGSTLLPATREQHDQNCTQSH